VDDFFARIHSELAHILYEHVNVGLGDELIVVFDFSRKHAPVLQAAYVLACDAHHYFAYLHAGGFGGCVYGSLNAVHGKVNVAHHPAAHSERLRPTHTNDFELIVFIDPTYDAGYFGSSYVEAHYDFRLLHGVTFLCKQFGLCISG
jgi:hypothetical protein